MIVTEKEAKAKACCKGSSYAVNQNVTCIGSACMAWRVMTEYRADSNEHIAKGYCGLAGMP